MKKILFIILILFLSSFTNDKEFYFHKNFSERIAYIINGLRLVETGKKFNIHHITDMRGYKGWSELKTDKYDGEGQVYDKILNDARVLELISDGKWSDLNLILLEFRQPSEVKYYLVFEYWNFEASDDFVITWHYKYNNNG